MKEKDESAAVEILSVIGSRLQPDYQGMVWNRNF